MFLDVDATKCNRDGLCIAECPAKLIEMGDDVPQAIAGAENICIHCGHCVAICPEEALSLSFLTPSDCLQIEEALQLNSSQVEQFLRSRRSIRTYQDKAVPKELLEKILTLASAAPTAVNRQPVRWIVLAEQEQVRTVTALVIDWMQFMVEHQPKIAAGFNMEFLISAFMDGEDRICRGAPHLVFAAAAKHVGSGKTDCDTALAYLELALPSMGLGSCWAGYVLHAVSQWKPLREYLLPSGDDEIYGAVMLGFPRYEYQRVPPRNKARITFI